MKTEQARTAAYFDSSVLLKRYVREKGSDQAVDFMRRYLIISSAIAPLEMRSALRRLHAESGLSARAFQATLARIQSERRKWDLVALSAEILQSAERLTVDLNLRSLDCIHLACALTCQSRLRRRLLFITADARQLECARNLDLEIVPIK
ncbi:MAG TPA: type II toxin-antitoxin system VapC family toxin [Terriglobia bacterium]|nr:type II toxin-antitoxin system VapC family toxin [Terriglobia bacterium]